jgi:hypothetical protein
LHIPPFFLNKSTVVIWKKMVTTEVLQRRICMLACIGYIVPEYFRWPGYLSPEKAREMGRVVLGGGLLEPPLSNRYIIIKHI